MVKQNLIKGNNFIKLQQKAKEFGAQSLDYSPRKNSKYVVTLENGKQIHFGSSFIMIKLDEITISNGLPKYEIKKESLLI